jgi:hypothetical protein
MRTAVDRLGEALIIYRAIGRRAGEAFALGNMSTLRSDLGDYRQSNEDGLAALRSTGRRTTRSARRSC